MNDEDFDELAFNISLVVRGVGYRHRKRLKPNVKDEDEAYEIGRRIADYVRENYGMSRKDDYAGHGGPYVPWGTHGS